MTKDNEPSREPFFDRQRWQDYFYNDTERLTRGKRQTMTDSWITGGQIRITSAPEVIENAINAVIEGAYAAQEMVGLEFRIKYRGKKSREYEPLDVATWSDKVSYAKLRGLVVCEESRDPYKGGHRHADIYVTDKHFWSYPKDWGYAQFRFGFAVISVPGDRQMDADTIRNIAKHEVTHLLGFNHHHDQEIHTIVQGYTDQRECNMLYETPTLTTCDKCSDALRAFWRGIEDRTGKRYLRG